MFKRKVFMRTGIAFLLLCMQALMAAGQIQLGGGGMQDPVTWQFQVSKGSLETGQQVELIFKAEIEPEWHMYGMDLPPQSAIPTSFSFEEHKSYKRIGDVRALNAEELEEAYESFRPNDSSLVNYYKHEAQFAQTIRVLASDPEIKGSIEYQACKKACITDEVDFDFSGKLSVTGQAKISEETQDAAHKQDKPKEAAVQDTSEKQKPIEDGAKQDRDSATKEVEAIVKTGKYAAPPKACSMGPPEGGEFYDEKDDEQNTSLWIFALVAFGSGLVALLTPCVFPMIPMTVTFFTHSSTSKAVQLRKALVYGLSIVFIYTVVGVIFSRLNGPDFANWLSTHWAPNIFFFLIFVFLAFSFLGMYELNLPNSWVNKADAKSEKGGLVGVFFMAFTLVLVSFSCTGPIVGAILVESAGGLVVKPIIGMFAFSLAFAVPFTLFAIFPSWLDNLPKSGGWLNAVKVVLGFIELALAFKFLSMADQVYHWNLLDRDVFLAIWIAIFSLMGLYLLGKFKLPHDGDIDTISVPRLLLALVTFGFVIYMIPGLFGAPLKAMSGYLPPQTTHDFDIPAMMRKAGENTICDEPKHGDKFELPHGLQGYFNFEQGMKCARRQDKPVFIDFTGHACVNCREMEARVWSDPGVLKRLREDYVVIALYVDDKTNLPEEDWYKSPYDQEIKKTIGGQNAEFQIREFRHNSQPFYVLLDNEGCLLAKPTAYNLNPQDFIDFLDKGKKEFDQRQ